MSTETEVQPSDEHGDALVGAAARVETLAMQLGIAYRQMTNSMGIIRQTVFLQSGAAGVTHIDALISPDRLRREFAGALVAAGLRDVLAETVDTPPVNDFANRWMTRIDQGQHKTPRRRKDHSDSRRTNPATPGQKLHSETVASEPVQSRVLGHGTAASEAARSKRWPA